MKEPTSKNLPFIFQSGTWLGEGIIEFSLMPGKLKFYSNWSILGDEEKKVFTAVQSIQVEGKPDKVENRLLYSDINSEKFKVTLSNAEVGKVEGKGVVSHEGLGWEYRACPEVFDGYEMYWYQEDGTFKVKAEYLSPDQVRTVIQGKLWQKN